MGVACWISMVASHLHVPHTCIIGILHFHGPAADDNYKIPLHTGLATWIYCTVVYTYEIQGTPVCTDTFMAIGHS